MNDQDFEKQLREWMADRAEAQPGELETLEAAAGRMPPRSRWLPVLRVAGAVVAAAAVAGIVVWAGDGLRGPAGSVTPSPEATDPPPSLPISTPTPSTSPDAEITRDIEPAWSSDGRRIAFARVTPDGLLSVWVMRSDGSDLRRVTEGRQPSWSPDGEWIAFQHQPVGQHAAIFRIRLDGTGLERLTDDGSDAGNPAWSPDGSTIAFQRQESDDDPRILLWLMDADGGGQRRLATVGFDDMAEPAWSPDGNEIAFSSSRDGSVEGRGPTPRSIWVIGRGGGEANRISQLEGVLGSPTWSPDARWLVWHDEEVGLVIHDLVNISEQTTGDLAREPAWSPTASELAYWVEEPSGAMSIYVATVSDLDELVDLVQLTP